MGRSTSFWFLLFSAGMASASALAATCEFDGFSPRDLEAAASRALAEGNPLTLKDCEALAREMGHGSEVPFIFLDERIKTTFVQTRPKDLRIKTECRLDGVAPALERVASIAQPLEDFHLALARHHDQPLVVESQDLNACLESAKARLGVAFDCGPHPWVPGQRAHCRTAQVEVQFTSQGHENTYLVEPK